MEFTLIPFLYCHFLVLERRERHALLGLTIGHQPDGLDIDIRLYQLPYVLLPRGTQHRHHKVAVVRLVGIVRRVSDLRLDGCTIHSNEPLEMIQHVPLESHPHWPFALEQ